MKKITNSIGLLGLAVLLVCGSCGKNKSEANDSGSDTQTTPNDSSGTESRSAIGVNEDNQKEVSGYPSNQANLNSDSTGKLHDLDTTGKTPPKDKPNKHQ